MEEKRKRGRPRNLDLNNLVLKAALAEVQRSGFRQTTSDDIAARAKVSKMAIYRRWPSKAAVVMDALLELVGPGTEFPKHESSVERLRLQLIRQVKFFASKEGELVRNLIGEMQFDGELAQAFRERWLEPRRKMTQEILKAAIEQNELRPDLDLEAVTDMIYGPFYYRLILGSGLLTVAFAKQIHAQALNGLKV